MCDTKCIFYFQRNNAGPIQISTIKNLRFEDQSNVTVQKNLDSFLIQSNGLNLFLIDIYTIVFTVLVFCVVQTLTRK